MRKKSKMTKELIAVSFLLGIIVLLTPVLAAGSNRVLFIAIGDDLDLNDLDIKATNLIIGKIDFSEGDELSSAKAVFHQKIYDDSGKKVYTMTGMLKDGYLINTSYYFLCPIFMFWFINVSQFVGEGLFKTTDTILDLTYRNCFDITMPNTEGKYVKAPMVMLLSPKGEYCLKDPGKYTPGSDDNPIDSLDQGGWVLTAVLCGIIVQTPDGPMQLPIGPLSYITRFIEI